MAESAHARRFSAGVVVVHFGEGAVQYLLLRAYKNWDFPKGLVEPGEGPLDAAVRAANISSAAIVGLVGNEAARREMAIPDAAMLAQLPNARLAFAAKHDPVEAFETAVRALIDGLRRA